MKAIHLYPELLTVESGLLTPTMKSKRPQIHKHFAEEIDAMYTEIAVKYGEKKSAFLS